MSFTIGRAARLAGVHVETIRFYERRGLIAQPERPQGGGFRQYTPEVVARIRFIRNAQELGFSLREARELLSLEAQAGADCGDVRERASDKLAEVDRKIVELMRMRGALQQVIEACPGRGASLRDCSIMESLTERPSRDGP